MKKFDVIVVGAGTGGCIAAKTVADAGFKVCLIDRKKREEVGDKVCGDAIGKHHFDNLELDYPVEDELEREMVGIKIYSPDMETVFSVEGEDLYGFMVNRHLFGQRLLKIATDAGADFMESTQALRPTIENRFLTGVSAKNLKTGREINLHGQVVVDASGLSSVLRSRLPPELEIDTAINKEDIIVCFREIRRLKEQISDTSFCEIYLNLQFAPGGYSWVFPESETKVNVGLGVVTSRSSPNPKKQLYNCILTKKLFKGSSIVRGGGGQVPTRRPLNCMTGNGIAIIGDAACQVNPIHGGGMGPSMMGGAIAGKTIVEAISNDDVSRSGLWQYNVGYMQSYGAKQAGLDVFRLFLQGLSNDDLDYGMKYHMITEKDLLKASMGEDIHLSVTEKTIRVFRGVKRLGFVKRLRDTASLIKRMRKHYRSYPSSPEGFGKWKNEMRNLVREAVKMRVAS
ncbi:MAG: NAD(P)/FAD-dependent oxidoreductase [Candidatus Bathyarchaeota archaeon]|nr:MAG: NAD(P)/FAD-dependent oxidoreductase [Candidatus Bathyarchaeota archaeon]